jgi:hypothetical protein
MRTYSRITLPDTACSVLGTPVVDDLEQAMTENVTPENLWG